MGHSLVFAPLPQLYSSHKACCDSQPRTFASAFCPQAQEMAQPPRQAHGSSSLVLSQMPRPHPAASLTAEVATGVCAEARGRSGRTGCTISVSCLWNCAVQRRALSRAGTRSSCTRPGLGAACCWPSGHVALPCTLLSPGTEPWHMVTSTPSGQVGFVPLQTTPGSEDTFLWTVWRHWPQPCGPEVQMGAPSRLLHPKSFHLQF